MCCKIITSGQIVHFYNTNIHIDVCILTVNKRYLVLRFCIIFRPQKNIPITNTILDTIEITAMIIGTKLAETISQINKSN